MLKFDFFYTAFYFYDASIEEIIYIIIIFLSGGLPNSVFLAALIACRLFYMLLGLIADRKKECPKDNLLNSSRMRIGTCQTQKISIVSVAS